MKESGCKILDVRLIANKVRGGWGLFVNLLEMEGCEKMAHWLHRYQIVCDYWSTITMENSGVEFHFCLLTTSLVWHP